MAAHPVAGLGKEASTGHIRRPGERFRLGRIDTRRTLWLDFG